MSQRTKGGIGPSFLAQIRPESDYLEPDSDTNLMHPNIQ